MRLSIQKKRKTSRSKKERYSRKSYNSAKKCIDHPIQIASILHPHLEPGDTDNLLEDPTTYKDTELDKVTSKIPKDKDYRKEKSSMHLGEEDGATIEYTFHGNNERNDESGKLFMDLYAKLDANKLKSRVEIEMQLGENVDRYETITGQDKGISMEDNQMSQSMCEQESVSAKRETRRNGSTKSSGTNGGFAPYHVGDNPSEKLLQVPHVGSMVITNRIHNQPQYACDKEQEVYGGHTFQDDPNSSQGNVTPKTMGIDSSSDKSRKKTKLKEKATDGNKIDLDDAKRCNDIEDGKEAHCDYSSHQCPSDHKEPDYQDHNFGIIRLDDPQCNDENKADGISEDKSEQSRGSSRRKNLTNDTTENSSNPLVGINSYMEQRNHSPNGPMTYYGRYEQHHDVNYSSYGNYGPWSHVPLQPVLSPTEFDANRRHDPYSYLREFQHDITRWQNPNFHPRSPGYFISEWHSSPYYPTRPMPVDYAHIANNISIHGYDERNNFMGVGYNARGITPTAIYPPLQFNNNGAYQPHTHVRTQGHGAAYGGHNREYGVRSRYTLSLGPHPQARRLVMDKYAPNLEQTNNQVRS